MEGGLEQDDPPIVKAVASRAGEKSLIVEPTMTKPVVKVSIKQLKSSRYVMLGN